MVRAILVLLRLERPARSLWNTNCSANSKPTSTTNMHTYKYTNTNCSANSKPTSSIKSIQIQILMRWFARVILVQQQLSRIQYSKINIGMTYRLILEQSTNCSMLLLKAQHSAKLYFYTPYQTLDLFVQINWTQYVFKCENCTTHHCFQTVETIASS